MRVIPVIDVRHGVAARARAGDRANYRPLETPLSATSDPVAVARGLLTLFPFDALYVADLDGIEGRGRNADLPARLGAAFPDVTLWVDDGMARLEAASAVPAHRNVVTVIGSESLRAEGSLLASKEGENGFPTAAGIFSPAAILSLDFRDDAFLGPLELLACPDLWPDRVIVMTLKRVGTGLGPDLARIADIAIRAGGRRVYAAGGVRCLDDLKAARDAGASGALISSALHAGTIKAGDLERAAGL